MSLSFNLVRIERWRDNVKKWFKKKTKQNTSRVERSVSRSLGSEPKWNLQGLFGQGFPDLVVHANSCTHSFNSYLVNANFVIGTLSSCPVPFTQPFSESYQYIVLICIFQLDKFILTISLYLFHSGSTDLSLLLLAVGEIFEIRTVQIKGQCIWNIWGEKTASSVGKSESYKETTQTPKHKIIRWDRKTTLRI